MGESNPIQPSSEGDWLATSFLSQFGYLPFVSGPTGNRTRISATPGRCRPVGPSARQSCVWSVSLSHKELRELESNQRPPGSEPGVTTNSNYPAVFFEPGQLLAIKVRNSKHSVRESHPICELQRLTPRLRAGESALRESNPPRQVGSLEPLPLGQEHMFVQRKGRESNPQGREARPGSSGVPSQVGLPFR